MQGEIIYTLSGFRPSEDVIVQSLDTSSVQESRNCVHANIGLYRRTEQTEDVDKVYSYQPFPVPCWLS